MDEIDDLSFPQDREAIILQLQQELAAWAMGDKSWINMIGQDNMSQESNLTYMHLKADSMHMQALAAAIQALKE